MTTELCGVPATVEEMLSPDGGHTCGSVRIISHVWVHGHTCSRHACTHSRKDVCADVGVVPRGHGQVMNLTSCEPYADMESKIMALRVLRLTRCDYS